MQQGSKHAALRNDQTAPPIGEALEQPSPKENALFLQGPVGPFFSRIAADLSLRGFAVHKINFNGGDKFFFRHPNAVDYVGKPDEWSDYLKVFIKKKNISRIYLFGDCRRYHRDARILAKQLGIDLFVFEEGYIRPNYITLERGGVNGFSPLMNRPALVDVDDEDVDAEFSAGRYGFLLSATFAMMYYMASSFYKSRFPDYSHHRPISCLSEGMVWIHSGYRKLVHASDGKKIVKTLERRFQNQYFLCPLQVHCDMQVVVHSEFDSIDQFICEVVSSFAKHAPCDHALVFKHHPLDRGYTNYKNLIFEMAKALHIDQRVYYVHDVCLPDLLRNAEGSVMINSTVGMSSLYHGTPVKVLGEAIYDRRGLTYQGPLDKFWKDPGEVDKDYVARFRAFLVRTTQLNGNIYKRCTTDSASGVVWSDRLLAEHSSGPDFDKSSMPGVRKITGTDTNAANKAQRDKPTDGFSESA